MDLRPGSVNKACRVRCRLSGSRAVVVAVMSRGIRFPRFLCHRAVGVCVSGVEERGLWPGCRPLGAADLTFPGAGGGAVEPLVQWTFAPRLRPRCSDARRRCGAWRGLVQVLVWCWFGRHLGSRIWVPSGDGGSASTALVQQDLGMVTSQLHQPKSGWLWQWRLWSGGSGAPPARWSGWSSSAATLVPCCNFFFRRGACTAGILNIFEGLFAKK